MYIAGTSPASDGCRTLHLTTRAPESTTNSIPSKRNHPQIQYFMAGISPESGGNKTVQSLLM